MSKEIKKAMILAAGLGTRLRPLTLTTPKPLIEVGGKRMIEHALDTLIKAGVNEVAINLHHLGGQVESYLGDGSRYGIGITYSHEPEILGTGGGIKKVGSFFGTEDFIVINCDLITDIDLMEAIDFHFKKGTPATLVLRRLKKKEPYTPIKTKDGFIAGFGAGDMMYTGMQIIKPSMLKGLPAGIFSDIVADCYKPHLSRGGKIGAYIFDGFWEEIGTLDKLEYVRESLKNYPSVIPAKAGIQ